MQRKYIIYGAGKWGRIYYNFLKHLNRESLVIGFCDRRYYEIEKIEDKRVFSYEEAKEYNVPFIVSVRDSDKRKDICQMMDEDHVKYCNIEDIAEEINMTRVELNREFCAFYHIHNMDCYFEGAESENSLKKFWGVDSEFKRCFQELDLTNVIELACGRGRHVSHYVESADEVTLVDILPQNIEFCKERFKDKSNITYYQNNGYNLEKLENDAYTALFCYDAMVHFEMMDIYDYLVDIYRVLVAGGKALLHHSNYDSDYRASFENSVQSRSFMNEKIFAYLAYRAGFKILRQKIIDWGEDKELDCISLLQKP